MRFYLQTIVFLLFVLLLTNCHHKEKDRDIFFCGEYPPVKAIYITDEGINYELFAVQGQCVVFFQDNISCANAKLIVERNGGTIIEQLPKYGYYLISVENGKESAFIRQMKAEKKAEYVFLNLAYATCSETYLFDGFSKLDSALLTSHGNAVKMTFSKYSSSLGQLNDVEIENSVLDSHYISLSSLIYRELLHTIKQPLNGNALVNISLGIPKENGDCRLYDDLQDNEQRNYRKFFEEQLKGYSICFKKMRNQGFSDFIVTLASGNEGMYDLKNIIDNLSEEEQFSLEKNMVLTSALDTKTRVLYSNSVSSKHPLVTTIDVTPEYWSGTSFAAPKLLGFVDKINEEFDKLNAQDILNAIRNATPSDPKQAMTFEMLHREAASLNEVRKRCKQHSFTLDLTTDHNGEWDLSGGNHQDIVKYNVHNTYSREYLSGETVAIEIENRTRYDLGIALCPPQSEKEIPPYIWVIEYGKKGFFTAGHSNIYGTYKQRSVKETHITIIKR